MKQKPVILLILAIIIIVYGVVSLLFIDSQDMVFGIGFFFLAMACSLIVSMICLADGRYSTVFPMDISTITRSAAYLLLALGINVLLGNIFRIDVKIFFSLHFICLAIFAILLLLILFMKQIIARQHSAEAARTEEL